MTRKKTLTLSRFKTQWSGARVAEEANLESLYTPKGYREFESPSLRKNVEWAHGSPQGPIAQLVRAPDS